MVGLLFVVPTFMVGRRRIRASIAYPNFFSAGERCSPYYISRSRLRPLLEKQIAINKRKDDLVAQERHRRAAPSNDRR
jgi:hypothetical protein